VRARSLTVPLPRLLCPVFFDGIRGMIRSDCVGTRLRCACGATGRGFQKLDPKCPVSSSEVPSHGTKPSLRERTVLSQPIAPLVFARGDSVFFVFDGTFPVSSSADIRNKPRVGKN
jgi:hypothetical protein